MRDKSPDFAAPPYTRRRPPVASHLAKETSRPVPAATTPSACASARSRRSQPRTVSMGTPRARATRRAPAPAAKPRHARPITTAASRRRSRTSSGSTTWVTPHPLHRTRGGRYRSSPSKPRTIRHRAWPHLLSPPPQFSQPPFPPVTRSFRDSFERSTIVMARAYHTVSRRGRRSVEPVSFLTRAAMVPIGRYGLG